MLNLFVKFLIVVVLVAVAPDSYANPKLFNKNERKTSGISEFPKWVDALKKHSDESTVYKEKCQKNKRLFYCNIDEWRKFTAELKDKPRLEQLKAVNDYANKHKYVIDMINWGIDDYWESPGEFLFKNGDCEDYAIIKYMSLKELGFEVEDMRIIVLYDNNINTHHSVLAVYDKKDIYILDNQINYVINSSKIYHYNPIYSVNENNWWVYM